MEEEDGKGNVILEIDIPKFIDTSLVDVDVQPTYASIVVKNKTTRLLFPYEVQPDDDFAEITGDRDIETGNAKINRVAKCVESSHSEEAKFQLGKNEKERKDKNMVLEKCRRIQKLVTR